MLKHGEAVYGYDLLFALRMDGKLRSIEAMIIPREVIATLNGTVTWSRALEAHPDGTYLEWDHHDEAWVEPAAA